LSYDKELQGEETVVRSEFQPLTEAELEELANQPPPLPGKLID
jgi:hypothetical protein